MIKFVKLVAGRAVVAVIQMYQWLISPLLPQTCRFTPTCSNYAIEAVRRHGVARGVLMALWRVARCHPFSAGGFDPVPEPRVCRSPE